MAKKLNFILEKLSENVMFRLSLCSKELFHSNFLAYLLEKSEKFPQVVKIFDESLTKAQNIKREWKHTDISFESGENLIIVENKFKSMPNQEQLKDYIEKIKQKEDNKKLSKVILLSYYKPHFELSNDNKVDITYLSYEDLYDKLNKIQELEEIKKYFADYCNMLELLLSLKKVLKLKNQQMTYGEMIKELKNAEKAAQKFNFYVTLQKIFLSELVSDLLQEEEIKEYNITPFVNYSKSFGTYLDLAIHHKNESFLISFLLKGHIFHREIGIKNQIKNKDFELKMLNHFMFNNKNEKNPKFLSNSRNKETGFWGFKGNESEQKGQKSTTKMSVAWLYKKVNIEESPEYNLLNMKYEEIKKLVIKEFAYITENLKNP